MNLILVQMEMLCEENIMNAENIAVKGEIYREFLNRNAF